MTATLEADEGTAVTRPIRAGWRRWTGRNLAAIRAFAGDEYAGIEGGTVLIRFGDTGYDQPLHPGWYLARYEGQDYVRVMSARNFRETFEVAEKTLRDGPLLSCYGTLWTS